MAERRKTDDALDAPIFISVTGHADICSEDIPRIESGLNDLFDRFRTDYPDTRLVLISALCQGADVVVSELALKRGMNVAPVIPMSLEDYKQTFSSQEYLHRMEAILDNELTYRPFVIETESDDERDSFTNLSAFLIFNSSVMISIWDGRCYERNGGTFDTTRMAYEGVDTDVLQNYTRTVSGMASDAPFHLRYLDSAEDCLIYWIPVSRESTEEQLLARGCKEPRRIKDGSEPGFIIPIVIWSEGAEPGIMSSKVVPSKDGIPKLYDGAFRRIDEFNKEVKKLCNGHPDAHHLDVSSVSSDKLESCFYLLSGSEKVQGIVEKVRGSDTMDLVARRYHVADALALDDQSSSFSTIRAMIIISALTGFFFSLFILTNGSVLINIIYTMLLLSGSALMYSHKKKGDYLKFIEYRALAESMRVEYYRTIMGIRRLIPNSCYGYMKNELLWIRGVLKSWNSPFMNDYDSLPNLNEEEVVELIRECWVDDQMRYHSKTQERNRQRLDRNRNEAKILTVATTAISAALVVSVMVFGGFMNGTISSTSSWNFFGIRLMPELDLTATFLIRALMVVLVALSTYVVASALLIHGGTPEQIESKKQIFVIAKLRMTDSDYQVQRAILLELGEQCISEMNDWVYEHRMKDYKAGVARTSLVDSDT